jgi:hypothetical protein
MLESRQERIRNKLNKLQADTSIESWLFPKEVARFKEEFPNINFQVMDTKEGTNYKKHLVKIYL